MRCRHHTKGETLPLIRRDGALNPSPLIRGPIVGVHVELEPFAPLRSLVSGQSAAEKVGLGRTDGAYVEFDVPKDLPLVPYRVGELQTAILVTDNPLDLTDLQPEYHVPPPWWRWLWLILVSERRR